MAHRAGWLLLAAAHCGIRLPAFTPDDLSFVFGPLLDASGERIVDAPVELLKAKDEGCFGSGVLGAGPSKLEFHDFLTDTTDGDGNFLFEMMLAEAQVYGRGGLTLGCFQIREQTRRSVITFEHPGMDLRSSGPDAVGRSKLAWTPGPGNSTRVEIPALPNVPGVNSVPQGSEALNSDRLRIQSGEGPSMWASPVARGTSSVPLAPEIFEDFLSPRALLVLGGEAAVQRSSAFQPEGIRFLTQVFSKPLALPPQTLVPSSRGAACPLASPCPFTDGKLDVMPAFATTPSGTVSSVSLTFSLTAPFKPRYVVVRNLTVAVRLSSDAPEISLSGSVDGKVWESLGVLGTYPLQAVVSLDRATEGAFFAAELPDSAPVVSQVRLSVGSEAILVALGEISLFE